MAAINVKPRVFKNYLLTIETDNYEKHVSAVTITPSASVQTWKGAAPGAMFTDTTSATYTCQIDYAQDWETPDSLSLYLMNNEGEEVTMSFSPTGEVAGPEFTLDVIITPGQIGGAIDSFGTASVTLGVQGKPVYTAPTP